MICQILAHTFKVFDLLLQLGHLLFDENVELPLVAHEPVLIVDQLANVNALGIAARAQAAHKKLLHCDISTIIQVQELEERPSIP
eukprot:CAMPEP_0181528278 /NCGR_PEP_ID=MMETSP1110-20121109/70457_1 /TAXON_ID=174948 /ORGANISM="Symbiodinium sp., Strain CCMP421" /LENGTH=84 /DNA_ID=CAMNT_0023659221 /DNA_START=5 /DNA_END=256 /DNA_ORIENTATION=+